MATTIEVKDVGPVETVSIPIPEGGGVVVLRGTHGSGKSTTLKAVNKMLGGKQSLSVRDDAKRGQVVMGEAKLTVSAKRAQKSGELQVDEIESRFDISDLVDPQIDDPERADVARLKALVRLSGCVGELSDYKELLPCDTYDIELTDDPIILHSRVKRSIEEEARRVEKVQQQAEAKAAVLAEELKGVNLSGEHDEAKLRKEYDEAKTRLDVITSKRSWAIDAIRKNKDSESKLEELLEEETDSLDRLLNLQDEKRQSIKESEDKIRKLEAQLEQAGNVLNMAIQELRGVESQIKQAKEREARIEQLRSGIVAVDEPPSVEDISEAQAEVELKMKAILHGEKIRVALAKQREFKERMKLARECKADAEKWRKNAAKTEDVLSSLIKSSALRVRKGRIVTTTDRDKNELYADLSHGERYKLAIDLAVESLPKGGLLTICQEAWDALNAELRQVIKDHAVSRGVVILTAEASVGNLRSEVL